jgi:UDP-glucose 4-epimerase
MARPTLIVTGGCGYIGAHTILQILRSGTYDVVSIDNLSNSNESILDRIAGITGTRVKNYTLDLRDRAATLAAFKEVGNVAGVIHFAAHKSVPESTKHPVEYYDNNINSLLNVIGACAEVGVRDLIFSSSCSVFGNVATLPVNEATPLNPVESPYALTKLIGEQLLADATKHMPLRAVALRYFNPVGADTTGLVGEQPTNARPNNLIPFVTRVAAGHLPQLTVYGDDYPTRDGTAVRDYIHVLDIADAHLLAFEHLRSEKAQPYEVFNLGSGEGVSVKEIVEAFIRVTGVPLNWSFGPRRPGDIAAIYSDSSRALSVLGWEPRRGLDEMMDSAWRWQLTLDGKG